MADGASAPIDPQVRAADPQASAFVTANAGSGKTKTLVDRVARLLLRGARPEAILCVTYTKAAAAEMQRRLFEQLGEWSMLGDARLADALERIGEDRRDLSRARTLFAHALEAPGGLKIETLHAFCEKLLRRFPLEAGVSPGFRVLDDAAAAEVAAEARDTLARAAMTGEPRLAQAWAAMASTLDFRAFEAMFDTFQARREAIGAYLARVGDLDGLAADVAQACELETPATPDAIRAQAVAPPALDPALWRAGTRALSESGARDQKCAAQMAMVAETAAAYGRGAAAQGADFDLALSVFVTQEGQAAKWVQTAKAVKADPALQARLLDEQARLMAAADTARAAQVAQATVHALTLAAVYIAAFTQAKASRGVLDFADLVARAGGLLAEREDAAWVLYKLDGGVDHVLLDEAQDTAPEQWGILSALTAEFFAGDGGRDVGLARTKFVVGDEKQSIYSFQGAQPERLAAEAEATGRAAQAAGHPFAHVRLEMSYRSTPQVLAYVDTVFEPQGLRAALQPRQAGMDGGDALIRHVAWRAQHAGAVELWPLEVEAPTEARRAWDAPLDRGAPRGAHRRLAERVAEEIKAIVARGDAVHDRKGARAATYGDVLILVRKRKALFAELLGALRRADVPAAGADRLALSEHPVFEDLRSLTRFVLYPADDLSLAEVLRSPLCDVDEAALFELAHGRAHTLWAALRRRGDERADWRAARALLDWAIEAAPRRAPFDFYGALLSRLDTNGLSMRQRFATRLGLEAADALDELLAQALAAEQRGVGDLERFADAIGRLDISVKREMDAPMEAGALGEVRILTAHSAKGLEAPIVFLPETVAGGAPKGSPLLETPEGGFLWSAAKDGDCTASRTAREWREARAAREDMRLLYVALTRARDRLVIAGRINARAKVETLKGWWAPMRAAFDHAALQGQVHEVARGDGGVVLRLGSAPAPAGRPAARVGPRLSEPSWLHHFAPAEREAAAMATPSAAEAGEGVRPAPSPLSDRYGLNRFRRGELIHRLLQTLPDLAPDRWANGAARMLAREPGLSDDQRAEMAAAALGVLRDMRFTEVFGPGSRAEAAVAGRADSLPFDMVVSGRVDRMVVAEDRVLVVDFKTNRPSPNRIEDADSGYIAQMAIYAAVLGAVFPGRRVEAALVWTDGPKLMAVPDPLMEAALARLRGQA